MHPKFYELRQRLFNEMKEHRQRHPFIAEPTFDQQPLTSELMEELMNEEHILNLLAVFGDQHPDGFYRFVAANYPELFDKWARQVAGPV